MNKRLIASMSCAALLLSATSLSVEANSARMFTTVDVVSAATTAVPAAPAVPKAVVKPVAKPAATTAKPATKSTTSTTSATVVHTDVTRLLAFGSVGNDVKLVQTWLNGNGYVLNVDGIYGKLTADAVTGYQGKNALRADGIIGPKTLAKLVPVVVAEPVTPVVPATPIEPAKPVEEIKEEIDVVTSASIVDNAVAFEKAMTKDGSWIIGALNDITFDKELTLDGEFTYKEKIQRKVALYTQDENKVTTAKFTLTAPKLTIKSPEASIQKGTFKGDLYVTTSNFKLVDAIIDGNVYFTNQEALDTFAPDATSSVTGVKELKVEEVDVVTSASLVNNEVDFEKGISKGGAWIISTLNNLTFDKDIILDGEFKNGKKTPEGADAIQRKIALYTQDDDKVVLERFTLTAPKLIVISPEARIQGGTFKGDVHVTVPNFQLVDAKVEGNIYFTTKAAQDSFKLDDKSSITGKQELLEVDVVTSASLVNNAADFEKGIATDGTWIISTLNDLTFDKEIVLEGELKNGKKTPEGADAIQRKIALYTQDDNKVVTARFTLTAPKLTITSPEARIQGGTFKGDVYVSVANFQLVDAKVEGNIYFTTQEAKDSFKLDAKSSVTGVQELKAN